MWGLKLRGGGGSKASTKGASGLQKGLGAFPPRVFFNFLRYFRILGSDLPRVSQKYWDYKPHHFVYG